MAQQQRRRQQILESDLSEDSDDEFLKQHVGRPTFAVSRNHSHSPVVENDKAAADTVDATPVTQSTKTSPAASTVTAATLSSEEMEQKAQAFVQDLKHDIVQHVCHRSEIGWRTTTKNKKKGSLFYYPCFRLSDNDTWQSLPGKNGLLDRDVSRKTCGVCYLGFHWSYQGQCERIGRTHFYSLRDAVKKDESTSDTDKLRFLPQTDEECLKLFLDQQFGVGPSLEKRMEELVIRKCWEKVRENELAKEEKERTEQEELDQIKAQPVVITKPLLAAVVVVADHDQADDDDDDDDDDDGGQIFFPDEQRKKIRLRPGDVVEYYLPVYVFGNAEGLRQSVIVGVDAKNRNFPLNLESGDLLPRTDKVRRVARMHRGTLIAEPEDSSFMDIESYELRTDGCHDAVGLQKMVHTIKQATQKYEESKEAFWQSNRVHEDATTADVDEECKALQGGDTENPTNADAANDSSKTMNWRKRLRGVLQETEENMKKKRRYAPKITPDELQLIIQVWSLLNYRIRPVSNSAMTELEMAVEILAEELEEDTVSEMRIEAILQGDPNNVLSDRKKVEALESLKRWVDKQQQEDEQEEPKEEEA